MVTSGMAWQPSILYCQQLLGVDRVLYAMDYPYQFVPEEVSVTDELPDQRRGQKDAVPNERGKGFRFALLVPHATRGPRRRQWGPDVEKRLVR